MSEDGELGVRRRVRNACQGCKASKIKCDGEQPCVNCLRKGKPCEYLVKTGEGCSDGGKSPAEVKTFPLRLGEEEMGGIDKFKHTVGSFVPCFPESILHAALHGKAEGKQDALYPKIQRSCLTATWAAAAYGAYLAGDAARADRYLESALTLYRGCFDVTTSETVWALLMLAMVHDLRGAADKVRLYTGFADVIYRSSDASDPALPVCIQFLKTLAHMIDPTIELEPAADANVERTFADIPLSLLILHQVNCAVRSCFQDSEHQCHYLQSLMDQLDAAGGFSANPIGYLALRGLFADACVATQRMREAICSLKKIESTFVGNPHLVCNLFSWRLLHGATHMLQAASYDAAAAIALLNQKANMVGVAEPANEVHHPFTVKAVERMQAAMRREHSFHQDAGIGNDFLKLAAYSEPRVQTPLSFFADQYEIRACGSTDSTSTESLQLSPPHAFDDDFFEISSFALKRESSYVTSDEGMPALKRAAKPSNFVVPYEDDSFFSAHNGVGTHNHYDHHDHHDHRHPTARTCGRMPDPAGPISYGSTQINLIDEPLGLPHVFYPHHAGDLPLGGFHL